VRIPEMYTQPDPTISFEFFPPKSDEAEEALFRETVPGLKLLNPAFISVTYGAGGSTRDTSFRVVDRLRREHGIEAMAHLTCVGHTRNDCSAILDEAERLGFENILALRGDPPKGEAQFRATPGGFSYAIDLVRYAKARDRFSIGVAGYPEGHVECSDKRLDWDRSAEKIEAGGEFILTQLFYDVNDFLAYEDYLRNKRKVKVPIIPGILPFLSGPQIRRFTKLCGSKLPAAMLKRLDELGDDDESVRQYGVEVCTEICARLLAHGTPGIHFYCLNRVTSCAAVVANLGLTGSP
jgi:methylenetetrahydrofolate reductase (NADH)